jgi:hypothetical protein
MEAASLVSLFGMGALTAAAVYVVIHYRLERRRAELQRNLNHRDGYRRTHLP